MGAGGGSEQTQSRAPSEAQKESSAHAGLFRFRVGVSSRCLGASAKSRNVALALKSLVPVEAGGVFLALAYWSSPPRGFHPPLLCHGAHAGTLRARI